MNFGVVEEEDEEDEEKEEGSGGQGIVRRGGMTGGLGFPSRDREGAKVEEEDEVKVTVLPPPARGTERLARQCLDPTVSAREEREYTRYMTCLYASMP